jgi:hypothetical protein
MRSTAEFHLQLDISIKPMTSGKKKVTQAA